MIYSKEETCWWCRVFGHKIYWMDYKLLMKKKVFVSATKARSGTLGWWCDRCGYVFKGHFPMPTKRNDLSKKEE